MSDVDEFLEHFGKKGMKWGVRKGSVGRTFPKSEDHKTAAALRVKPKAALSNHELETVNKRLGLEKQFKQLNPHSVKSGADKTKEIISIIGVGVSVHQLLKSPAGKSAMELGKKILTKK